MTFWNVIATTTSAFAILIRSFPHPTQKLRMQLLSRLAVGLILPAMLVSALLHAKQLFAEDPACPVSSSSASKTLNVPKYLGGRALVDGDYVVIEYNAKDNKTTWSDYKRVFHNYDLGKSTNPIVWNGSFLPVIDTKEKIAVRVCGLQFTDVLTVTTGPIGVPEGGADIRGASPASPVTSLSSTLDTLQSGMPTGGTTTLPGLGLNAPAALPSLAITGITPGTLGGEDQTPGKFPTYTPATVTASGKQVALLLYFVDRNTVELGRLIDRTRGIPYPDASDPAEKTKDRRNAPGSVNGVSYILRKVLSDVKDDSKDNSNFAKFDKHLTDIQNINAQISTLSSALSSQAFASNAIALLNDYSALTGILDLAKLGSRTTGNNCQNNLSSLQPFNFNNLGSDDIKKLTINDFANWTASQVLLLSDRQIGKLSDQPDPAAPGLPPIRQRVRSLRAALSQLHITAPGSSSDKPLCSLFEKQKFDDFWDSYSSQILLLNCGNDPVCTAELISENFPNNFEGIAGDALKGLEGQLNTLRSSLRQIDTDATELYDRMNEWYFNSSVEQTDLLPPLTTNALARISIVVQRGYTPFTLANPGGTITPTASNNVIPTTVAAASTSTPSHAVKTILVEVHRVANFNLVGGTMFIHIPTASYGVQASPTPAAVDKTSSTGYTGTCAGQTSPVPAPATGTNPPAYSCIVQTQQTEWQLAGMAGLVWFPWGHDYFPRHSGYVNLGRNLLPSILLATSVTSLGNSMGGVNWEPVSGLDFYAGLGSAHRTALPDGLTVNTALPSGATISTFTQEHAGLTVGVGFDLSVITTLFGSKSTSVATMP